MTTSETPIDSKDRILLAAEHLFSAKGFDGTRVSQIAEQAGVNKALIYYYFKSKDEILESLIDKLIQEMKQESARAVQEDRFKMFGGSETSFAMLDEETKTRYLEYALQEMINFCLKRKRIFRIMLMESLKSGNWNSLLFRIPDLMNDQEMAAVFQDKDIDLKIGRSEMVSSFFLQLMPLVSFAVYFDAWKEAYQMADEELIETFIRQFTPLYYRALQPVLK